jgi:hypothetical protein
MPLALQALEICALESALQVVGCLVQSVSQHSLPAPPTCLMQKRPALHGLDASQECVRSPTQWPPSQVDGSVQMLAGTVSGPLAMGWHDPLAQVLHGVLQGTSQQCPSIQKLLWQVSVSVFIIIEQS